MAHTPKTKFGIPVRQAQPGETLIVTRFYGRSKGKKRPFTCLAVTGVRKVVVVADKTPVEVSVPGEKSRLISNGPYLVRNTPGAFEFEDANSSERFRINARLIDVSVTVTNPAATASSKPVQCSDGSADGVVPIDAPNSQGLAANTTTADSGGDGPPEDLDGDEGDDEKDEEENASVPVEACRTAVQ